MRLVKVHGGSDVLRNDSIALPELRNAIDLHGEQDRNAHAIQFTRQHDRRGCTPTVPKEYNARPRLFLVAERAIMIAVEHPQNGFVGSSPMPVLEDLNVG